MRCPDSAGGTHGWAQAGTRGRAVGGEALLFWLCSDACSHRRLYIPAQAPPPLPPRRAPARQGRSSERCPGAAGKTRTGLTAPSPPLSTSDSLPPPRPPSQISFGHLDAAGSEAGVAAAAPQDPRVLARSSQSELPRASSFTSFPCNFTNT